MSASSSFQDHLDKMKLQFDQSFGEFRCRSGLAVVAVLFFAMAQPVMAQSYGERPQNREYNRQRQLESQPSPSDSPSNLPDWAEPSQSQDDSFVGQDAGAKATPPGPPSDPQQVPVDGGLALLAAAGAGYAVRKLNEDDDEEDDLP